MARKTIRKLAGQSLVDVTHHVMRGSAGRPENVIVPREKAIRILKERNMIDPDIPTELLSKTDYRTLGHQLLTNWVRIGLERVVQLKSNLNVDYLNPLTNQNLYEFGLTGSAATSRLIPDGIFTITDSIQHKSLLFFLEVDMGTEVLASDRILTKDIKKKVLGYQAIFKNGLYRRLGGTSETTFGGFRVLFVANNKPRLDQLCRLVISIPSTGFVWLTDESRLFDPGVSGKIWVRGGDHGIEMQSILGTSQAFDCPIRPPV
jgi:hypothetical protein